MRLIKESGVDSLPGGGAEIFHPEIREQIANDMLFASIGIMHDPIDVMY